jgi:hypothetical protein
MKEFIFLFRSEEKNISKLSPDEMQEYMKKWGIWTKKLVDTGRFKFGDKLSWQDAKVVADFGGTITDGPHMESKEVIGGYIVIEAENMNQAVEISKECPVYNIKGVVEVRTSAY